MRPSRRRLLVVAGAAAVPWLWFAVDDLGVPAEAVGMALPAIGVLSAVLAFVLIHPRRTRWAALPLLSLTVMTVVAVVLPWSPHDSDPPRPTVTVVGANVMAIAGTRGVGEIVGDIEAQDPDIVVISEVSSPVDDRLAGEYPYRSVGGDLGVYSRLPFGPAPSVPFVEARRARVVRVDGPAGPFLLLGVHLPKPGRSAAGDRQVTFGRYEQLVAELAAWIERQDVPVVVAGDLNMPDRGPAYHRMTGVADDAMRAGWAAPTSLKWPQRLLLLRIDHVFVPEGWCWADSTRFDLRGSDHRGVRTDVGPCG